MPYQPRWFNKMPTILIPHKEIETRVDLLEKLLNDTYKSKDQHRFCCSVMPEKLDDPYQFANVSITILLYRGKRGKEEYSDSLEGKDFGPLRIGDYIDSVDGLIKHSDEQIQNLRVTPEEKLKRAIIAGVEDVVGYTKEYVTKKDLYFGQDPPLLRWAR